MLKPLTIMNKQARLTGKVIVLISGALILSAFAVFTPAARASTVNVSGSITTSTTWTSGNVYVIQGALSVSGATLTIASGTVVKLDSPSTYLQIQSGGTLQVNGVSGSPVYFTSLKDDSVGGDTNGDGTATSAGSGDWNQIEIDSGATANIDNAIIRYGGGYAYPYVRSDFYIPGGNVSISNSQISNAAFYGLYINGGTISIATTTISNNGTYGFYANGAPSLTLATSMLTGNGSAAGYVDVGGGIIFTPSGNNASGTDAGYLITGSIATTTTWYKDIPYIVSAITVPSGKTLNINHGAIVKFQNTSSYINVSGVLDAEGTSGDKIYFTSIKDDLAFGDTNGDGVSSPGGGDWDDIEIDSAASSTINNAVIRYGGAYAYPYMRSDVYVSGGSISLSGTQLATSSLYGLLTAGGVVSISNGTINGNGSYGIYETGSSGTLGVTNNTFANNTTYDGYINLANGITFTHSGNTWTSGNEEHGFAMVGSLGSDETWAKDGLPYIITASGVTVPSGKTLTINPGVINKFDLTSAYLQVGGSLKAIGTSGDPIYFTSIKDDSISGDTNGDGTTTAPVAGDWDDIEVDSGSTATITHSILEYGGAYAYPYIRADIYQTGGTLNLINSTISHAFNCGLCVSGGAAFLDLTEVTGNQYGIYLSGGAAEVINSSFHGNSSGEYNGTSATSSLYMENNYWGDSSGPSNPNNSGGLGETASAYIDFANWMHSWPTNDEQSAYLDGGSAWNYPASNVSFTATDPFTIEAWYRVPTTTNQIDLLSTQNGSGSKGYFVQRDPTAGIRFFIKCDSGEMYFNGAPTSTDPLLNASYDTDGAWHQVTITKGSGVSGSAFNLYFDGVSQMITWTASSSLSGNCFTSTSSDLIWLGKNANSNTNFLTGNLDEIRISNFEKSASAVQNDWNKKALSTANLLGLWQFNGTSTDLITSNHSTGYGSPSFGTSTPLGGHFLMDQVQYPTAAQDGQVLWYSSGTNYNNSMNAAAPVWMGFGGLNIASTTNVASATVIVSDIDSSSSDSVFMGVWNHDPTSSVSTMEFNRYWMAPASLNQREHTAIHELGHAIGLNHSFLGNIMNYYVTDQTDLGIQDIYDFLYLRGENIWGNY